MGRRINFRSYLNLEKGTPAYYAVIGGVIAVLFLFAVWIYQPPTESTTAVDIPPKVDKTSSSKEPRGGDASTIGEEDDAPITDTSGEDNVPISNTLGNDNVPILDNAYEKYEDSSKVAPVGSRSELTIENREAEAPDVWDSQAKESVEEKQPTIQQPENDPQQDISNETVYNAENLSFSSFEWKNCDWADATDYIPCLDNVQAIRKLPTTKHYEHRERHCPEDDKTMCLVPLPEGYQTPIRWPQSRYQVWYSNVPHPGLVSYKKGQNWVTRRGDVLIFPGGGTQFKRGAQRYIDFIEKTLPAVAWGTRTRVVLDIGCGVASFGGYLFEKEVITMSFAPKDEHEAQVQLALERGIPAILSVMGTQRLVFPSNVYDMVHCSRCRVPWHIDGGRLLLEVNRVLRPGGYFVWSATPVYKHEVEDVGLWKAMESLTKSMCWLLLAREKDSRVGIGIAIYQKPKDNTCYNERLDTEPGMCLKTDKPDAAWYVPMNNCLHEIPTDPLARSSNWPDIWPERLDTAPSWLHTVPKGLFGKPGVFDFEEDTAHWKHVIERSYRSPTFGINWNGIRNIMDMKAGYGGFGAALSDLPVWVMNVVPVHEPDTLPIIFDRGLIGLYHDWCESFNTYPRTYDLLHVDHLFSHLDDRCSPTKILLEMDRILRPEGWVIFRDTVLTVKIIEPIVQSLHWKVHSSYIQEQEELFVVQKAFWRPGAAL